MSVLSAVTGRPLAASTIAGYAADWALFTDWCAATNQQPLPADPATIAGFSIACQAAPATQRRRLAAIEHHHRAAGSEMPWKAAGSTDAARPIRAREMLDPDLVVAALRLLPSRGWTAGLFGRRDKALLTLAASTDLPYQELAVMRVGQLQIVDGVAGVTDTSGEMRIVEATADAVLCGPCALARWRRVVDAEVGGTSAKRMAQLLKGAHPVTPASRHVCQAPTSIRAKTLPVPLFPPINQWGHLPLPIHPLSRHAISILARQVQTGLPAHRDLDVDEVVDILSPAETEAGEPAPPRPTYDWAAANQKKKDAIAQLASLSTTMDDIDARINQLIDRTRNLDLD